MLPFPSRDCSPLARTKVDQPADMKIEWAHDDVIALLSSLRFEILTSAPERRICHCICQACCNGASGSAKLTLFDGKIYRFLRNGTEEQNENHIDGSEISKQST